ncbi:MAG: hypothetical protein R3E86_22650, partial [Pseudomonadales bacterium]
AMPLPELGMRVSDFDLFYAHFEHPGLISRLFHQAERLRVDTLLRRTYPGITRHMRRYHAYLLEQASLELADDLGGLLQLVDWLLLGADAALLETLDLTARLAPAQQILADLEQSPGDVYQSVEAACLLYALCDPLLDARQGLPPMPLDEELSGPASWMQREARLDDWRQDLEAMNSIVLDVEMLLGEEAAAADAEGLSDGELRPDDVHLNAIRRDRDTLARRVDMERSAIADALGRTRNGARSFRYDEWDYLQQRYLPRWCRLYEERLTPDYEQDLGALQAVIRRHRAEVQKPFEQIKPLGYQRVFGVADGDELDFNAVIQARQDSRAGQTPDDRVYSRRERVHRDVCAAFLVDLSASTDDAIDPPPPAQWDADDEEIANLRDPFALDADEIPVDEAPRRRIIDVQRESMLVMSAALEQLGDSYGIYGFSGYGRDCVEFFVAKEPDEPFNRDTLAAIAGMTPKRSTRMGPAIRHAVRKLIASGNALKVLLILSDGFPQDSDYGPERGEHEYGVQDTARALKEAHEKGVETFCVTVDRSGHDYLRRMCADARYLVIDEIEDLPQALSKVYQALTS